MTNKKIFRVLALAAFVAMVVIAPLQAAPDCGKPGCPKKGDQEKMMSKGCMMLKNIPNLSDEQKGKLEKLHAEHMKVMMAAKADIEKQSMEMKAMMKDPIDVMKIEVEIDEIAKRTANMHKKCLAHHLVVRALLTVEQKAKLDEMGCGMGCGMMMHGQGCCKMAGEKMQGKCGQMKKEMKMDHSACLKAAEAKKEEKK